MIKPFGIRVQLWVATGLFLVLASSAGFARSTSRSKCTQTPLSYETQNYRVNDVRIDSPLGWLFGSVEDKLTAVLSAPSMKVKKGALFHKADEDQDFIKVTEAFPELTVSALDRIAVRVAAPTLQNCNPQTKTLDVVYRVYTIGFSYYLSRAFETGQKGEVKRSVVDTGATKVLANYFPQPLIGYDRSRQLYGGTKLTIKQPQGLFDKISLEALGSPTSSNEKAEITGSHDRKTGLIRHLDYQFRYLHSNLPTTTTHLKEGSGLGQIVAATRAYGTGELILRFGASMEAGNKQSDLRPFQIPVANLAQSPYGAVKFFAGATMRFGRHAFKESYGIELGSAVKGAQLDYVKQVFDSAANLRFLVADHKPLTLDLQFTTGSIRNRGRLPIAERFFGGNAVRNFIAGDSWMISSNPYIRSFPENSLAQTDATGVLGGDKFFSANVTAAATIWSKPLVPREILEDPQFNGLVEFEFGTAETALKLEYLSSTPEFRAVAEMVGPISEKLVQTSTLLEALKQKNLNSEINGQVDLCLADLDDINETVTKINEDLAEGAAKSSDIRTLAVGFLDKKPPIAAEVSDLIDDLTDLKDLDGIPDPAVIQTLVQELDTRRQAMANAFTAVHQSPAAEKAGRQAHEVMVYPRRVFNELSGEANIIAVSPVFIFDAARLRRQTVGLGDVRYAVGGGMRLSIVSLDVIAAYAWNPNRKPWESRGALFLTMEISNLFR